MLGEVGGFFPPSRPVDFNLEKHFEFWNVSHTEFLNYLFCNILNIFTVFSYYFLTNTVTNVITKQAKVTENQVEISFQCPLTDKK